MSENFLVVWEPPPRPPGIGCRTLLLLEISTLRHILPQPSLQCWGRLGDFTLILLMKKLRPGEVNAFPKVVECRLLTPNSLFFSQWYALVPPRLLPNVWEDTGSH